MTLINILVLALIQGFSKLLPISSSAHLILVPAVTGWPDQGLMVDAALDARASLGQGAGLP